MSSDDSHWRSHITPTACNICTRAIFPTSSFNLGFPTYFVSRCCYRRRPFSKKSRAELFDCGLANDTSKVTQCWCASRRHHVFVLLSSVALVHLKINFAWLYQRLVLLSFKKTTVQEDYSTHQFAWVFFFLEIIVCVIHLFVDFVIWHSRTTGF